MKNKRQIIFQSLRCHLCIVCGICLLCAVKSQDLMAQNNIGKRIIGFVEDVTGEPLIGVNIVEKGKNQNGTITDINGSFSISVSSVYSSLIVSYIGYIKREYSLEKYIPDNTLRIVLTEDTQNLEEVVVVGYGVQKKQSVTGAITSVNSTELMKSPVSNVSNAIYGRLSGVTLVQRGGEPGKDQSDIRIRGISTLGSGDSSPLIVVDGVERSSMDGIDMNEIESINVLKDASATAVYGIRGANGVMILTTKIGKEAKPMVSFSANVGMQTPTTLPDFLSPYRFAVLKNEGAINDDLPILFDANSLEKLRIGSDPVFFPTQDLYLSFFKEVSLKQQYNLNISGGTKDIRYFVSLGYLNQEGQYNTKDLSKLSIGFDPNPLYIRYNVRSNFDFNFTENFTGSIKLAAQISDSNYPNNNTESIFSSILGCPPMIGCGLIDGKLITGYLDDPMSFLAGRGVSPTSILLNNGYNNAIDNTLNANISIKYNFDDYVKGLSVRAMYAYDHNYSRMMVRNRTIDTYYAVRDFATDEISFPQKTFEGGFQTFKESHNYYRVSYFEVAIDYNRIFGKHRVGGLLLYNQRKQRRPGLEYSVPASLQGVVSRGTYSFADRYLGEFNIGYNGSENFPTSLRYGVFPAFSLAWVLSEEPFFPKNDVLNFVKIRGSYGEVGNDKIGNNRFLYLPDTYGYVNNNIYQFGTDGVDRENYKGAMEGQMGNPLVTWERAVKQNIGIDIRLFEDRLLLGGDYFSEKRDNILIKRGTVPAIVGSNNLPAVNMGKVTNKGFEMEAHWRGKINKFSYNIDGNFSYARNIILFRDEANAAYDWMMSTGFSVGQLKAYRNDGFYNYAEEVLNRPFYSFYGNKVQQGDLKYIDIDGDGKIDQNDQVPTGYNQFPQINYGISASAEWRNFDFSILFQGASQITMQQRVMTAWAFNLGANMTLAEHENRWTQERFDQGNLITMPRLSNDGAQSPNSQNSDFWIKDASYLRLKNLEIGYSMPLLILKKSGIKVLRFYLNGNNVFTFTSLKNADPENPTTNVGAVYPQMRVFNVGINLKF